MALNQASAGNRCPDCSGRRHAFGDEARANFGSGSEALIVVVVIGNYGFPLLTAVGYRAVHVEQRIPSKPSRPVVVDLGGIEPPSEIPAQRFIQP